MNIYFSVFRIHGNITARNLKLDTYPFYSEPLFRNNYCKRFRLT